MKLSTDQCWFLEGVSPELEDYIRNITTPDRVESFLLAARTIARHGTKNLIETGCFRGTYADGSSTLVLAAIARENGTYLDSYELSAQNIATSKSILAQHGLAQYVHFHQGDSILALASRSQPVGFAYLDSYDCGLGSHRPSQEHQLAELEAVLPILEPQASILLDDHVEPKGGKTKLSIDRLNQLGFTQLHFGYQVYYESDNTKRLPKAKFAILCGHSPEYAPLAVHTIYKNKALYCHRYGYDLRVERGVRSKWVDGKSHASGFSWSRLEAMLDLVESGNYEWVYCVGADTLITNQTISLDSIVETAETPEALSTPLPAFIPFTDSPAPAKAIHWQDNGKPTTGKKHLLICGECFAPMQADSFIVRGSKEGADYLRDILAQYPVYKHHTWVENQTMIDLREKHGAITKIVPAWMLNSYDCSRWYNVFPRFKQNKDCYGHRMNWQRGDFLIHWPASSLQQRLAWLPKYEKQIIQ